MDKRIAELNTGFEGFVQTFGASDRFTGPSWYFHRKTLQRRAEHLTIGSILEDDLFFDTLYATLTAWGLHRMGPGNAKLRDLADLRESVRAAAKALDNLAQMSIVNVSEAETAALIEQLWSVLTNLRVSVAAAQIVANSKTLHHLLPSLVPPMDREYTYRFFYGRNMLSVDERTAFSEIFTRFVRVASANKHVICKLTGGPWNTSHAKVLDNAIVGYMISREGVKLPSIAMEPTAIGSDA